MAIEATVVQETTPQPTTVITVSAVLGDLNNGMDRAAIAIKYGLSAVETTEVFKHPKLKGLRARRKITRISIIDDTAEDNPVTIPNVQPVTPSHGLDQTVTERNHSEVVTNPNQLDLLDLIVDAESAI